MTGIMNRYRDIMKARNRTLLLFEMTFGIIFIVLLLPLFNYGLEYVLHLWGQSYITAENLMAFLKFPPTLLLILISLMVLAIFLLFKMTTSIYYCSNINADEKTDILHVLMVGFIRTLRCLITGNIVLPFYVLFLYLFTNLPVLIGITVYGRIGFTGGASDEIFIKGCIILGLILVSFVAFQGSFVVHFCTNERLSFQNGLAQSKMLLQGHRLKAFGTLMFFNFGLTFGFFVLYYVILFLAALQVYLFADKALVVTVFLSVYPRINIYTTVFFSMIAFITNINIISTLYNSYREEDFKEIQPDSFLYPKLSSLHTIKIHKRIIIGFLLFILATGVFNYYLTIKNDSFYLKDALSGIRISSHRGNSHVAPENTLPALDNAIIARSDYAEIDIRQTKDQVIVLMHDESLWRTAGLNQNIWALNFKQVEELDAGTWFGLEFMHTPVPTLEEAFQFCKGKIKLNIEIKSSGHEIEEQLVALIEQYDFEYQCIVSSRSYDSLIRVKQLNSNIKTGLILTAAYGNFYDKKYVDFFSIRSQFITSHIVESAHRAGKAVHVWTVNSINEIERVKSIGVDCIITDNPTLTREILYRNDNNQTFIQLLRQMLHNRSFYSLVYG